MTPKKVTKKTQVKGGRDASSGVKKTTQTKKAASKPPANAVKKGKKAGKKEDAGPKDLAIDSVPLSQLDLSKVGITQLEAAQKSAKKVHYYYDWSKFKEAGLVDMWTRLISDAEIDYTDGNTPEEIFKCLSRDPIFFTTYHLTDGSKTAILYEMMAFNDGAPSPSACVWEKGTNDKLCAVATSTCTDGGYSIEQNYMPLLSKTRLLKALKRDGLGTKEEFDLEGWEEDTDRHDGGGFSLY